MAYQGWIQLHRKILVSDIWPKERPYTDSELFIYLMLKANHKDNYTNWYGKREFVRRGQHLISILKLSKITITRSDQGSLPIFHTSRITEIITLKYIRKLDKHGCNSLNGNGMYFLSYAFDFVLFAVDITGYLKPGIISAKGQFY